MIYHKDIGFPLSFRRPVGTFIIIPSRHARYRSREKGFDIPEKIDMRGYQVIEIEMSAARTEKLVIRGRYDDLRDIALVVIPRGGTFFVKTAWLNDRDDKHSTLDVTKYAIP